MRLSSKLVRGHLYARVLHHGGSLKVVTRVTADRQAAHGLRTKKWRALRPAVYSFPGGRESYFVPAADTPTRRGRAGRHHRVLCLFGGLELGIRLEAAFREIHALVLFLFGYPETQREFDNEPDQQARRENPGEYGNEAE